ncbi:MAG: T9SS type A sorting domain-containing protein [Sphingobacteriales bacterium]|nr:T9SS type A sorting domain-containing protein [Sphingobacteriales bacterium]
MLLFLKIWVFIVISPPEARAQNAEFAPVGAKWSYMQHYVGPPYGYTFWSVHSEAVGDTLIEGKSCRMIKGYHNAYLHIENGVVERYFNGEFYTLFDFNKNKGEFWYSKIPNELDTIKIQVDSVKSVEITEGIFSKRLYVTATGIDANCGPTPVYIHIGSIDSFMGSATDFFPFYFCGTDYFLPSLHCYQDNEIQVTLPFWNITDCDYTNVGFNDNATGEAMPRIFPSLVRDKRLYCENHLFEEGSITINNLQGVAVFHQPVYKGVSALDLPTLPQGMYWVIFQSKNYYSIAKIVIQP